MWLLPFVTVRGVPTVTENTLGKGKLRNVQARLLDDELTAVEDRLVELAGRTDAATKTERKALEARRKVSLARRARIATFVPAAILQPWPPEEKKVEAPVGGGGQPGTP